MPKRSKNDDLERYMKRKLRKMEEKFKKKLQKRSEKRECESFSDDGSISVALSSPKEVAEEIQSKSFLEELETEIMSPAHILESGSCNEILCNPEEESLPAEIIEILGETPSAEKKYGSRLHNDIALRWEYTATTGLTKDQRKDILEKHLVPENAKQIEAPMLNAEVKAALSDVLIKKDKTIEQKQKQIALLISCVGEALTSALQNKNCSNIKLIKSLTDAGKLACDLQHTESMLRRGYVCSFLKKNIKDQLYNTKIDNHLFGDNLAETLKAAKAINKSGAEIKNQHQIQNIRKNSQNLNWKPLPPPGRQTGVTSKRLPAIATATASTSMGVRHPQRRPAPPAPPPQRAYLQRSWNQAQRHK